jgi:hypothetical protein
MCPWTTSHLLHPFTLAFLFVFHFDFDFLRQTKQDSFIAEKFLGQWAPEKESKETLLGVPVEPQNLKKDEQLKYDYVWGY